MSHLRSVNGQGILPVRWRNWGSFNLLPVAVLTFFDERTGVATVASGTSSSTLSSAAWIERFFVGRPWLSPLSSVWHRHCPSRVEGWGFRSYGLRWMWCRWCRIPYLGSTSLCLLCWNDRFFAIVGQYYVAFLAFIVNRGRRSLYGMIWAFYRRWGIWWSSRSFFYFAGGGFTYPILLG